MQEPNKKTDTDPITQPSEVEHSNDEKITQDVPGFPHHPSSPDEIKKKKADKSDVDNAPD